MNFIKWIQDMFLSSQHGRKGSFSDGSQFGLYKYLKEMDRRENTQVIGIEDNEWKLHCQYVLDHKCEYTNMIQEALQCWDKHKKPLNDDQLFSRLSLSPCDKNETVVQKVMLPDRTKLKFIVTSRTQDAWNGMVQSLGLVENQKMWYPVKFTASLWDKVERLLLPWFGATDRSRFPLLLTFLVTQTKSFMSIQDIYSLAQLLDPTMRELMWLLWYRTWYTSRSPKIPELLFKPCELLDSVELKSPLDLEPKQTFRFGAFQFSFFRLDTEKTIPLFVAHMNELVETSRFARKGMPSLRYSYLQRILQKEQETATHAITVTVWPYNSDHDYICAYLFGTLHSDSIETLAVAAVDWGISPSPSLGIIVQAIWISFALRNGIKKSILSASDYRLLPYYSYIGYRMCKSSYSLKGDELTLEHEQQLQKPHEVQKWYETLQPSLFGYQMFCTISEETTVLQIAKTKFNIIEHMPPSVLLRPECSF